MTKLIRCSAAVLLVVWSQVFAQSGFDHASYLTRDADELIANAPKVESVLTTPEGRQMFPKDAVSKAAMRVIRPEKIRLHVVLAGKPTPIKSDGSIVPHENALRIIGWNPPPQARYIVNVMTQKGKTLRPHIQDVLVEPLVKEVQANGKITLYALLFYYDKNGPGLIVNEFEEGWH